MKGLMIHRLHLHNFDTKLIRLLFQYSLKKEFEFA